MKIFKFKYFIADVIISLFLYFMSTQQFHDFIKIVNACRNNYKLTTKTFILFKNLNHNERNDENDDVAKNQYVTEFIKKTNFIFFKNLIINVSHSFKE